MSVDSAFVSILMTLAAVVALGWCLGKLLQWVGQPPVIGEVAAGILLGPTLLGRVWPEASAFLLPASALPSLNVLAQIGIVLYMFLIGLELDPGLLQGRTHAAFAIAFASIAGPFALGAALAPWLHASLAQADVPFVSFALFLGTAMSITALPVLARILADLQMRMTPTGTLALACAAVNDALAWGLLAFVVSVARAQMDGLFLVLGLTIGYLAFMLLIARPLFQRWLGSTASSSVSRRTAVLVLLGLFLSALATELIGLHAIFGAFLYGAIIPHDSAVARWFIDRLEDLVTIVLLPAYFALTGMRTEIALISGWEAWLTCLVLIAVATAGKVGGTLGAARCVGIGWREASILGALMNTRGLMELIVLNVGLELRIISPMLFAMMVLMALATTLAATPILHLLGVPRSRAGEA